MLKAQRAGAPDINSPSSGIVDFRFSRFCQGRQSKWSCPCTTTIITMLLLLLMIMSTSMGIIVLPIALV